MAILSATAAPAQDVSAAPTYGAVTLAAGFSPDPRVIEVDAGAAGIAAPCAGLVREAADVRLHYTGSSQPLIISAASAADTTLLISGPTGA